jgi:hypothetical protein
MKSAGQVVCVRLAMIVTLAACIGLLTTWQAAAQSPPATAPAQAASPSGPAAAAPAAGPPGAGRPVQAPQNLLGPPPVQLEPLPLDLGVVRPGGKADGTIMIHNISDRWLLIKASKASCTCTAVNLANTSLAPGQAIPMDVSYRASSVAGEKKNSVRILFEGYDVIEAPIVAMVAMPVRSDPTYIDAIKHQDGSQALSGQFTVYSSDHKAFRVLAVNGREPAFVDFNRQTDTPRDAYALRWDLTRFDEGTCKNESGERMPGFFVVETDHPDAPMIDLEVRHLCNMRSQPTPMDTWALQDKRLILGVMKPGESTEVEVEAKWIPRRERIEPPHIAVAESPLFSVKIVGTTKTEDGMMIKLQVTMAKEASGYVQGVARVYSNRQQSPLSIVARVQP